MCWLLNSIKRPTFVAFLYPLALSMVLYIDYLWDTQRLATCRLLWTVYYVLLLYHLYLMIVSPYRNYVQSRCCLQLVTFLCLALKILSKIGFQLKLLLNSVGIWSVVRGPNQLIELSIDVLSIKWIKYSSGTFRSTLTIGTTIDPFLLVSFII